MLTKRTVFAAAASLLLAVGVIATDAGPGRLSATSASAQAKLTEADVKAYVTRMEQRGATGVGSTHKSVTLAFESVRIGKTRKANRQDDIDGIHNGATVYPVQVKYVSHRRWGNGQTEAAPIHYQYSFYKDEFGEWNALGNGPVRTR